MRWNLILCGYILCNNLWSQNISTSTTLELSFEDIKSKLESITTRYIEHSTVLQQYPDDLSLLSEVMMPKQTGLDETAALAAFQAVDLEYAKPTGGLSWNGSYINNPSGSLIGEEGFFYRQRLTTGLRWSLLGNGWKHEKDKYRRTLLEHEIDSLLLVDSKQDADYYANYDYIIYLFNAQKIELIKRHISLVDQVLDVAYQLFYLKYIHWEEVIQLMSKKAEAEVALQNYRTYNQQVELPFAVESTRLGLFPYITIDFEKLKSLGVDTTLYSQIAELQSSKEDLSRKWDFLPQLNTFLQYSLFEGGVTTGQQRDFITAGIQFNIPIVSKKSIREERRKLHQSYLSNKYFHQLQAEQNELLNLFYEFEYTHRQFIHFYHKKIMAVNQIQRELLKKDLSDPGFSPMEIATNLDALYSIDLELLDIHQSGYLKILKILQLTDSDHWMDFLIIEDVHEHFKSHFQSKQVVVGPLAFQQYDPAFISSYLLKNRIRTIYVHPENWDAAKSLNESAEIEDVRLALNGDHLIGRDISERMKSWKDQGVEVLQVDMAPERKPDWEDNKQLYAQEYNRLIGQLSQEFAVTVKVLPSAHWIMSQDSSLQSIAIHWDRTDDQGLDTWLRFAQNSQTTLQIEVNCTPFRDRLQLEEFITKLENYQYISDILLGDLHDMIELEQKTIQMYEKQRF